MNEWCKNSQQEISIFLITNDFKDTKNRHPSCCPKSQSIYIKNGIIHKKK